VKVVPTELPGVLLIEPRVAADDRGYFLETFNAARYADAGVPTTFVQDNVSLSRGGVLRGLHYQHPYGQAKLVQVLRGEVFDVAVDIRVDSPTFGRWVGAYLSETNKRQLYVPQGFAHGFLVTSDEALFAYKCSEYYHPETERAVRWDDPALAIAWPRADVTLSPKDQGAAPLASIARELLPSVAEPAP